jgi:hypothetical protein
MIPLGTVIHPYGRVIACGWKKELYYVLVRGRQITHIPAAILEAYARA